MNNKNTEKANKVKKSLVVNSPTSVKTNTNMSNKNETGHEGFESDRSTTTTQYDVDAAFDMY
jgi:hypothetical protein